MAGGTSPILWHIPDMLKAAYPGEKRASPSHSFSRCNPSQDTSHYSQSGNRPQVSHEKNPLTFQLYMVV